VTGGHCKGVIEKEVAKIEGVTAVSADPTSKDVVVSPSLAGVLAF
jgi:copper chaperone CopZ